MLDRALSRAESSSAEAAGGVFIATHSPFQVFGELAKVVGSARSEILIVDPYVNATALTDIATSARADVQIFILGDRAGTSRASRRRSVAGKRNTRHRALWRSASRYKSLHDRLLLIDRSEVPVPVDRRLCEKITCVDRAEQHRDCKGEGGCVPRPLEGLCVIFLIS